MSDNKSQYPSASKNLLEKFIGKKIRKLTRYSWWPGSEASTECNISEELVFSMTEGPLGVAFDDGSVLCIADDSAINSAVIWLDKDVGGISVRRPTLDNDSELFPIDATDERFAKLDFKKIIGSTVTNFSILRPKSMNALQAELPSEIGLVLQLSNGDALIAMRELESGSSDFNVLIRKSMSPLKQDQWIESNLF